jgi:hypothetical protein
MLEYVRGCSEQIGGPNKTRKSMKASSVGGSTIGAMLSRDYIIGAIDKLFSILLKELG